MAQEMNRIGGDIIRIKTVGDVVSDVRNAIEAAMSRSDIVLMTGGLGPTKDDMTKNILCDYFDSRLIFDKDVKQNIDDLFAKRGIAMNILTENQALVPDKSRVIMNRVGTAPCLWFEKEGKILVAMPGVPLEMKWLMRKEIIPRLENLFRENGTILHHTCQVCDYSESALAEKLSAFETAMPASFKLAYLPKAGVIRLRLTGKGYLYFLD